MQVHDGKRALENFLKTCDKNLRMNKSHQFIKTPAKPVPHPHSKKPAADFYANVPRRRGCPCQSVSMSHLQKSARMSHSFALFRVASLDARAAKRSPYTHMTEHRVRPTTCRAEVRRRRINPQPSTCFNECILQTLNPSSSAPKIIANFAAVAPFARTSKRKLHYFCTVFASFLQIEAVTKCSGDNGWSRSVTFSHLWSRAPMGSRPLPPSREIPYPSNSVKKW